MKKYYIQTGVISIIVVAALIYALTQTSQSRTKKNPYTNSTIPTSTPQTISNQAIPTTASISTAASLSSPTNVPSLTTTILTPTASIPLKNLRIGGGLKEETDFFSGVIGDVRFYNKALSETEVVALFKELNPETNPDLQKGLIGWWKLDDNAADSTFNRNDGSITGAVLTTNRQGQPNKSYLFNGKDSYINIENNTSYSDISAITLTAWVKSSLFSNDLHQLIIGRINNTGYRAARYDFGMGIGMGTREKLDCFFGGSGWIASTTNPIDNRWHMVTCTYDGISTRVYVDGKLESKAK